MRVIILITGKENEAWESQYHYVIKSISARIWSIKQHFLRSSPKRNRDLGILAIDHTTEEFHQNKTISHLG